MHPATRMFLLLLSRSLLRLRSSPPRSCILATLNPLVARRARLEGSSWSMTVVDRTLGTKLGSWCCCVAVRVQLVGVERS